MLSTLYSKIKGDSSETLSEGRELPEFTIKNQYGEEVESSEIQNAVIYFYPKANTPGCTKEACNFRDSIEELNQAELEVYGVSTDSVETQRRFSREQELNFELLADEDGELAEKFGVMRPTGFPQRTTFIVREGEVREVFEKVDPENHVQDVLDYLEE